MAEIYYARLDEFWKKEEKYAFLEEKEDISNIDWKIIEPDEKQNWLTEGLHSEFETFLPMGTKAAKSETGKAIFRNYGRGIVTCRDSWAYNFRKEGLSKNIKYTVEVYNDHVSKWSSLSEKTDVDKFVTYDDTKISWSRDLKLDLKRGNTAKFNVTKIRESLYRPFTKKYLFFDKVLNEEIYQFPHIFPTPETEKKNNAICVNGIGSSRTPDCLMVSKIVDLGIMDKTQCFPFHTYDKDGTNHRENITDWALEQFRARYNDNRITKSDIFYYVYAILHHPEYREKYAANLKQELPRIPFVPDFQAFAKAGKQLADLHVNYEEQPEYPLGFIEKEDTPLDWRVEKMRLSKDKKTLIYNDFLTLSGIPAESFDYRLGNRSALEWIIDQYRIRTDKRSGITNDPNQPDDPQYIVRLIGKVIFVSLETVKIIKELPEFVCNL